MGKSFKKNIEKIKGPEKENYHKKVRRITKKFLLKEYIPDSKELVNDYDYIDYISYGKGKKKS